MTPFDVLLVEDNPADARLLVESLKDATPGGFRVTQVVRLSAAAEALGRGRADVIVLDLSLPDSQGLEGVKRLREVAPGVPVVVLTGLADEATALRALRHGVQDYLVKGKCEGDLAARSLRYAVERSRTEAAVRSAEEQLRSITDAVPALISFVDRDCCYRLANRAYERWFGVRRDHLVGRHMRDVLGDSAWEKIRPWMERALAGEEVTFDDQLFYLGGGPRWVSITYTPYRDPHGTVQGAVVLVNDISRRRAAEEALRQSEARSQLAQQVGHVGIFDWDFVTGSSVWTAVQEDIYGLPPGTFAGTHRAWLERVHPEDRAEADRRLSRWLADRRPNNQMEYRIVRPDGEVRWVNNRGAATYDAAGRPVRIIGTTIDVTDRRRSEDALRDSEARLRAIVETAVDAVVTIDARGIIDSTNPATERLFGYSRDEMAGRNVAMLMPEPFRSSHDQYLQRYFRTGEARIIGVGREVLGRRKDGSTFPLDLSVSEFRVGDRRMFTGILHDASNRRRLEREILEASANEQRRVGHELHDGLCQQLTGVSFGVEILARKLRDAAPDLVPRAREIAGEVDNAITQARTLARGLNPVEIHAESLGHALEDLARKVSDTLQVACRFSQAGGAAIAVPDNTAATHLFRIAQEAISNAVRHGRAKRIELRLEAKDGALSLSVIDDGNGFAPQGPAARRGTSSEGIGLRTMAYRSNLINGILDVRPGQEKGVVVTCSIPNPGASRRE